VVLHSVRSSLNYSGHLLAMFTLMLTLSRTAHQRLSIASFACCNSVWCSLMFVFVRFQQLIGCLHISVSLKQMRFNPCVVIQGQYLGRCWVTNIEKRLAFALGSSDIDVQILTDYLSLKYISLLQVKALPVVIIWLLLGKITGMAIVTVLCTSWGKGSVWGFMNHTFLSIVLAI